MGDIPQLVLDDLTLAAIQAEATRAHLKHGEHSMLGPAYTEHERLAILLEEAGEAAVEAQRLLFQNLALLASVPSDLLRSVGQVAHRLTYDQPDDRTELVRELIQVAAMAATWVQYLEGGKRQPETDAQVTARWRGSGMDAQALRDNGIRG